MRAASCLEHTSAAALWDLRASGAVIVDVTIAGGGSRKRNGLRVHRARSLAGETTTHDGIPVTTPARTILDLAATLQPRRLERLLDQAENTRLTDVPSLVALARAHRGHRGASRLLATLNTHAPGTTLTKSTLEELFLQLCRDHGLPQPEVNSDSTGVEVDFLFRDHRLIVETDGWRFHRTRLAFESDRRRDQVHTVLGYRTLRFTHDQLSTAPREVARTLRAGMALAAPETEDQKMSEQSGGAGDTAREMREHEREARERDPDERDAETTGAGNPAPDVASEPAPPGNVQTGEVSGGS